MLDSVSFISYVNGTLDYQKQTNMKITVTGSLGYVSTPIIKELTKRGYAVKVISRKNMVF